MAKGELHYIRQGTALLFPSCLYHQLVYIEEHTIKLCLFLEDTEEIIAPESSARTTCGWGIRQQSDLFINKLKWSLGGKNHEEEK